MSTVQQNQIRFSLYTATDFIWLAPLSEPEHALKCRVRVMGFVQLATHSKRGEFRGFAPPTGPLLRRLHQRRPRPGQGQLANRSPALGAVALRVRGLRLHLHQGADRGAEVRPTALSTGRKKKSTGCSATRGVIGQPTMSSVDRMSIS